MLAYVGTKVNGSVLGAVKSRSYSTKSSGKPVLAWKHSHAATTPQYVAELPAAQHGVSPTLIAKMRRLREEAPATFTSRRLASNFHLPKKTVNLVAPYIRHGKTVRAVSVMSQTCFLSFTVQTRILPILLTHGVLNTNLGCQPSDRRT